MAKRKKPPVREHSDEFLVSRMDDGRYKLVLGEDAARTLVCQIAGVDDYELAFRIAERMNIIQEMAVGSNFFEGG